MHISTSIGVFPLAAVGHENTDEETDEIYLQDMRCSPHLYH